MLTEPQVKLQKNSLIVLESVTMQLKSCVQTLLTASCLLLTDHQKHKGLKTEVQEGYHTGALVPL